MGYIIANFVTKSSHKVKKDLKIQMRGITKSLIGGTNEGADHADEEGKEAPGCVLPEDNAKEKERRVSMVSLCESCKKSCKQPLICVRCPNYEEKE